MVESGGCILALDHRIPNGTPLVNYKQYLTRLRELMGLDIVVYGRNRNSHDSDYRPVPGIQW
jgi:hypothetical protein